MEICVLSDLHLDFWVKPNLSTDKQKEKIKEFIYDSQPYKADVLIMPGDISHYPKQIEMLCIVLKEMNLWNKILLTFGNHEMYLVSGNQKSDYRTSWDKILHIKELLEDIEDVHFMDGDLVQYKGINIGGFGSWYDFSYGIDNFNETKESMLLNWKKIMNDSNYIKGDKIVSELMPSPMYTSSYSKIYNFHPLDFFEKEKKKLLKILPHADIMFSHIGPVVPELPLKFKNLVTGFYYFKGEELVEKYKPKMWFFGHTHDLYHFNYANTEFLCNPVGYPGEKANAKIVGLEFQ